MPFQAASLIVFITDAKVTLLLLHFVECLDNDSTSSQVKGQHDGNGAIEPQEFAIFVCEKTVLLLPKPGLQINTIKVFFDQRITLKRKITVLKADKLFALHSIYAIELPPLVFPMHND